MATRVLIVDDHPLTRDALAGLLTHHDFSVVGDAASGEDAIELAREVQPDLIVLDLSMPGIGGLGALPLLREAAPDCEVVMLTASVAEENLLASIRAGAAGYLLFGMMNWIYNCRIPPRCRRGRSGALGIGRAKPAREGARRPPHRRRGARLDRPRAQRPRGRGAAVARRALEHGSDRSPALHLGAHRPFACEEPAAEARRLLPPPGARGARRGS